MVLLLPSHMLSRQNFLFRERTPQLIRCWSSIDTFFRATGVCRYWGRFRKRIAKFADAVYVLHCFQKKTEKTNKADLDLAAKRYRDLLQGLG